MKKRAKKTLKMTNILSAKNAIDAEINLLEGRLKICCQIREELNSLTDNNAGLVVVPTMNLAPDNTTPKIDLEQFKDYPHNKRLFERLNYLDEKFPRAWKMNSRVELMVQIEGERSRERFRNMSQELKMLINSEMYVGAKYYNDNKSQFYCRPEWLSEDGKSIKPEHEPLPEDFGNMPEYKRKPETIKWVRKITKN